MTSASAVCGEILGVVKPENQPLPEDRRAPSSPTRSANYSQPRRYRRPRYRASGSLKRKVRRIVHSQGRELVDALLVVAHPFVADEFVVGKRYSDASSATVMAKSS